MNKLRILALTIAIAALLVLASSAHGSLFAPQPDVPCRYLPASTHYTCR